MASPLTKTGKNAEECILPNLKTCKAGIIRLVYTAKDF